MRQALVLVIVAALSLVSVVRAEIGMCAYLWYGLMRPDIFAYVEDKYPISLLFAVLALLRTLTAGVPDISRTMFANPLVRLLFLLQIPIAISVIFAYDRDLSIPRYSFYIRIIAVLIFIPLAIRTEDHMRLAFLTIAGSLGFVGVKFGLFGIVQGGADMSARGWGSMMADNNFLSLALASNLAMCWFGRYVTSLKIFRMILLGMFCCSIAAVVMSNSRGGVVATGIAMLMIVFQSKNKILSLVMVLGMMAGSVYLVQDMFFKRMSTLTSDTQEISAESRLEHAKIAIRMWADHPIFGVGFGGLNYGTLVRFYNNYGFSGLDEHVAHNSYLQELVDSGPIAFLLYVGELVYAIVWLGKTSRRQRKQNVPLATVAITRGLQISLITFAVGSTFYSANRMDLLYMLLMMTAAWWAIQKQQQDQAIAGPADTALARINPLVYQKG